MSSFIIFDVIRHARLLSVALESRSYNLNTNNFQSRFAMLFRTCQITIFSSLEIFDVGVCIYIIDIVHYFHITKWRRVNGGITKWRRVNGGITKWHRVNGGITKWKVIKT